MDKYRATVEQSDLLQIKKLIMPEMSISCLWTWYHVSLICVNWDLYSINV